ncbi:MAG: hemerythrin domain-containing protein [bacterium]|nr:hemerythrin domain-containing protein [bacterium]
MEEATKILSEEHEGIKRVLALIEKAREKVEKKQNLPINFIPEILDFIKTFADTCHHGKEEGVLFPLLEKRGIPKDGGPIGMMLMEHDMGRDHVKAAAESYQQGGIVESLDHLSNYGQLLQAHIDKEDNILYPMGNEVLNSKDQEYLKNEFEKVEREKIGPGRHEAYHKMIEKWGKTL